METPIERRHRGRPRAFDAERALDAALGVFWQHGYEGTSLDELTTAMGISRPSLYAAFGNKESLFGKAVERYVGRVADRMRAILDEPTCRRVVERFFREMVVGSCADGASRGCMLVAAALSCSEAAQSVRRSLIDRRTDHERALRARFERGVAERDLPADASPADLARFVTTVQQGLSVHAAAGATRAEQLAVVEVALRAWPATHQAAARRAAARRAAR